MRSSAVSRIQRRLGFRKDLAAAILDELISAQEVFERGVPVPIVASAYMGRFLAGGGSFLPWFLRSEVTSAVTCAGEERVSVPADFIREWDDDALYYFNPNPNPVPPYLPGNWWPLEKNELSYNRMRWGPHWPSMTPPFPQPPPQPDFPGPRAYSLDGFYFRIFPLPDQVYQLKLIYYAHDAPLDPVNDTENKWLKHAPYVLIGEAGYQMAATARDNDRMQYFEKMRDEALARAFVDTIAQDAEGRRYIMGRDD